MLTFLFSFLPVVLFFSFFFNRHMPFVAACHALRVFVQQIPRKKVVKKLMTSPFFCFLCVCVFFPLLPKDAVFSQLVATFCVFLCNKFRPNMKKDDEQGASWPLEPLFGSFNRSFGDFPCFDNISWEQSPERTKTKTKMTKHARDLLTRERERERKWSVSYTHLTLPTIYSV